MGRSRAKAGEVGRPNRGPRLPRVIASGATQRQLNAARVALHLPGTTPCAAGRCDDYAPTMGTFRIGDAAELLGVSPDTVRRWVDAGRVAAVRDEHGHRVIEGPDLAAFVRSLGDDPAEGAYRSSARNRLRGIITAIVKDKVMAQVDIQAGRFRIVSLMSREAVDELGLEVGSVATAVIKSTTVVVERG